MAVAESADLLFTREGYKGL